MTKPSGKYKLMVKLIGPQGETIDSWTDELPDNTIGSQNGKAYFRPSVIRQKLLLMVAQMVAFCNARGWVDHDHMILETTPIVTFSRVGDAPPKASHAPGEVQELTHVHEIKDDERRVIGFIR